MSDQITKALADAITAAIRETGGRRPLAALLGCTTESLRRWACGEREPTFRMAAAIFEAAGKPLWGDQESVDSRLARIESLITTSLSETRTAGPNQTAYRENVEAAYRDLLAGLTELERAATERLGSTLSIEPPRKKS